METKSKQGGGIAIVVPPAVRAFIEGKTEKIVKSALVRVVDTPRLPQDTQQLVGALLPRSRSRYKAHQLRRNRTNLNKLFWRWQRARESR